MRKSLFLVLIIVLLSSCAKKETDSQRFLVKANEELRLKNHPEAIRLYGEAIRLNPDYTEAYHNRGVAYFETNKHFEAIQDFNEALRIDPDYRDSYFARLNAYLAAGYYERGLADSRKLREWYPDSGLVWSLEGTFLIALHRYEEAIPVLDTAIDKEPYYADRINRGMAHFNLYDYATAKTDLRAAIKQNPAEASAWMNLGLACAETGNYDSALLCLGKARALEPGNSYLDNNEGYVLLMQDKAEEALQLINASIAKDPENPWALRNKAIYYYQQGDLSSAMRLLQQVEEKEPGIMHVNYYLGEVYRAMADAATAEQYFARAREKGDPMAIL